MYSRVTTDKIIDLHSCYLKKFSYALFKIILLPKPAFLATTDMLSAKCLAFCALVCFVWIKYTVHIGKWREIRSQQKES